MICKMMNYGKRVFSGVATLSLPSSFSNCRTKFFSIPEGPMKSFFLPRSSKHEATKVVSVCNKSTACSANAQLQLLLENSKLKKGPNYVKKNLQELPTILVWAPL